MDQNAMIDRFFEKLSEIKSSVNIIKKYPPILISRHNRSMIVRNFGEICNLMNRNPENMKNFIENTIFGKVSNNGKITLSETGILEFHEFVSSETINGTIKKYLNEYCKCHQCENLKTSLVKDDRIFYIECLGCNSKKPIRMNF